MYCIIHTLIYLLCIFTYILYRYIICICLRMPSVWRERFLYIYIVYRDFYINFIYMPENVFCLERYFNVYMYIRDISVYIYV